MASAFFFHEAPPTYKLRQIASEAKSMMNLKTRAWQPRMDDHREKVQNLSP